MEFVKLGEENKGRELTSVLENDEVRVELKNGALIESANISINPAGKASGVAVCCGDVPDTVMRTAENLVNLAIGMKCRGLSNETCIEGMRASLELALDIFDKAYVEAEDLGEDATKCTVERRRDK